MRKLYKIFITLLIAPFLSALPTAIDETAFTLTTDMDSLADAVAAVDKALGSRQRTVQQVMDLGNRDREALCHDDVWAPLSTQSGSEVAGFCWKDGDDSTEYWYPQGITTSHDADETGQFEDHQIILTSWYHKPEEEGAGTPNKGMRISFVDWDTDFPADTYRHVLLVEPTADGNYKAVPVHAGGIVWFGKKLYVCNTHHGFLIFDMDHIYEVDTGDDIGKSGDNYFAYGYKLIMLQTGTITNDGDYLRFSFAALDRASDPISIIVGEYDPPGAEGNNSHKVVRWQLDETNNLPLGEGGSSVATEGYETGYASMQGALARGKKFWFASSAGGGEPSENYGVLRSWDSTTEEVNEHDWLFGPEDMSYYGGGDEPGRIVTLCEYPNHRVVVLVPEADYN